MRTAKVLLIPMMLAGSCYASDLRILSSELVKEDSSLVQVLEVKNEGFRHLKPILWVDVYDSLRTHVGRFHSKRQVTFANATAFFRIKLSGLVEGTYTGLVVGQYVSSKSSDNIDDSITLLGTLRRFSLPLTKSVAGNVIQRDKVSPASAATSAMIFDGAIIHPSRQLCQVQPKYYGVRNLVIVVNDGLAVAPRPQQHARDPKDERAERGLLS